MSTVIVVAVFVALVAVVALLAWRPPKRVQVTTCCSARPWPPTDLVGERQVARATRAGR